MLRDLDVLCAGSACKRRFIIGSARRFDDESALIKSEIPIINVHQILQVAWCVVRAVIISRSET